MPADVAQRRRAEQRVADRVQQHVGIGMAEQAPVIRNVHAADDQLAPLYQLVNVETLSDSHVISSIKTHLQATEYTETTEKISGSLCVLCDLCGSLLFCFNSNSAISKSCG